MGDPAASPDARMGLGAVAERQGRREEALAHYIAVNRLRPGNVRAHSALARLYADKGDYILAINEHRQAARNAPEDPAPLFDLSLLYARLGNSAFALRHLEAALSKDAGLRARAGREPAFAALREKPAFRALIGAAKKAGEEKP